MKDWAEQYKGYWLRCTPLPAPGDKFAPNLVVERHNGPSVDAIPVGVVGAADFYDTEESAANAARIAGRQWVDDNG